MAIYQPNIRAYKRINLHINILIDRYQESQLPRQSPYYLLVSRINNHIVINKPYQHLAQQLQQMIANDWNLSLLIKG
jgi:hypothetical protein